MFSLEGKRALVTGSSRGIGKGIALCLAKAGASVAVNYHSNKEKAEEVVKEIKVLGVESFSVKANVSNREDVRSMIEQIKSRFGSLDILVNNAGVVTFNSIEEMDEEEWDKVIDVNLKGQFLCIKEAINIMPKNGKIINISSIASGGAGVGFGRIPHYAASKGGIIGLTEDLAIDLAERGINVNSIAPGVIETDMTEGMVTDEEVSKRLLNHIPKNRFGLPEDIGNAAVFLSSDEADYINGAVLYVDGGWLTK
jgi:3-oxoacyl-[acyl-carrier protein] reductase